MTYEIVHKCDHCKKVLEVRSDRKPLHIATWLGDVWAKELLEKTRDIVLLRQGEFCDYDCGIAWLKAQKKEIYTGANK